MPDRSKSDAAKDGSAIFSTPPAIPSTALKGSRWQLVTASAMLALWIAFLAAMALYSS
jgi:hypothetical protein